MFALEEAISFFDAQTITRAYFVCIIAYYVAILLDQNNLHLDADLFTE